MTLPRKPGVSHNDPSGTSTTREHDIVSEPSAVLLVGITGAGKTHLAQALAARGLVRLSVDEEIHRLHGRYGVDYPEHGYFEREAPAVETVRAQLTEHLHASHAVVLDHGLWRRSDRDEWKKTVRAAGGRPLIVYPASNQGGPSAAPSRTQPAPGRQFLDRDSRCLGRLLRPVRTACWR
ncbi:AAA family ATPase [Streptomyces sp. NPDC005231]|uniref:AAA family ATPase n=1 Tax=Streptomyces sp. NPDC005231 TaxID=3157026 RepID=UPI0033A02425